MKKGLLEHYALALFELSKENNEIETYYQDITLFTDTLNDNPDLFSCLCSYNLSVDKKTNLIDTIFKDHIKPASLHFFHILARKHLIKDINGIYKAYLHLYNEEKNVAEGILYTAFPLKEAKVKQIEETFSKQLGKQIKLKTEIDSSLLAGVKIFIQDTMYDYSLNTKIDVIKDKLLYKKL